MSQIACTLAEKRVLRAEANRALAGTFEADAKKYLGAVTAMDDYKKRKNHINRWVGVFGRKRRDEITSVDIRKWRDHWMMELDLSRDRAAL